MHWLKKYLENGNSGKNVYIKSWTIIIIAWDFVVARIWFQHNTLISLSSTSWLWPPIQQPAAGGWRMILNGSQPPSTQPWMLYTWMSSKHLFSFEFILNVIAGTMRSPAATAANNRIHIYIHFIRNWNVFKIIEFHIYLSIFLKWFSILYVLYNTNSKRIIIMHCLWFKFLFDYTFLFEK